MFSLNKVLICLFSCSVIILFASDTSTTDSSVTDSTPSASSSSSTVQAPVNSSDKERDELLALGVAGLGAYKFRNRIDGELNKFDLLKDLRDRHKNKKSDYRRDEKDPLAGSERVTI